MKDDITKTVGSAVEACEAYENHGIVKSLRALGEFMKQQYATAFANGAEAKLSKAFSKDMDKIISKYLNYDFTSAPTKRAVSSAASAAGCSEDELIAKVNAGRRAQHTKQILGKLSSKK